MSEPGHLLALDHNTAGIWMRMSPNRFPAVDRQGDYLAVHDRQPADAQVRPRAVVPTHLIGPHPELQTPAYRRSPAFNPSFPDDMLKT
jgi:hypothetical protein